MRGVNLVILAGYVIAEPKVRDTHAGTKVARLTLRTKRVFKDRESGEWKEVKGWHRVVVFGGLAKLVEERVSKGDPLLVRGRMETRKWTDDKQVDRWVTEVVVEEVELLARRAASEEGPAEEDEPEAESFSDDLPF